MNRRCFEFSSFHAVSKGVKKILRFSFQNMLRYFKSYVLFHPLAALSYLRVTFFLFLSLETSPTKLK